MHFGTLLCIQILLLAWFAFAAPPLPIQPSIEETLSNNDTEHFSPDLPIEAFSPDEFALFNFSDIETDAFKNVSEWPQEPLKCDKSEQSWMCPPPDDHLGSIPLDITFEPTQLIIKCSDNISCAQFPVLDRELGAIQALKVHWCEALSASCVLHSGALPPSSLRRLTLDGAALDKLDELVGLEKLTFNGYGKSDEDPWVVPLKSLKHMSSLRTLCVRGGHAALPAAGFSERAPLLRLELANLGMARLPEKPFSGLDKLTSLGLWNNKFKELGPDVFYGLKALTSLSLSGNQLSSIPRSSLAHVPTLKDLTIKSNYLKRIDAGDFNGLHNLTTLDLSDNRAELTISAGAFTELTSLASLRLIGSRVTSLSSAGAPALRVLDLSRNLLQALTADAFRTATGLKTLILDSNKLEELPRNLLQFQTSLETLSLSNNRLRDVTRSALAGARYTLRTLRLSKNQISFANDSAYLDLYSPLQDLLNLSDLDLSYNLIMDVFNDWQYNLLHLQSLNLSHNRIKTLVDEATRFLASNVTVDMRYNNITTVLASSGVSSGGSGGDSGGAAAATLLLAHNPLRCDCRLHALLRLPRAVPAPAATGFTLSAGAARLRLDDATCAEPAGLRGAPLSALPLQALSCEMHACPRSCRCSVRPATAALELACSSWPLRDAPPALPAPGYGYVLRLETRLAAEAALANIGALPAYTRVLNCSGLGLPAVPDSSSATPGNLDEVDLRGNTLSAPPELALAEHGPRVLLGGNPLRCDCEHSVVLARLAAQATRVDYAALRCAGGGAVRAAGGPAALCLARHAAIAGGVLGALALLLLVAALLLWHYSLELRVWLASRGLLARWIDAGELQCEFDAFVSYSHLDEKFVVEELVPALEGARRPRALCLHYRDWRAGEAIAANVARSVARSRRTLVVLSRNFLASEWGRLELRVAVAAALRSARGVLLVLLEDVAGDPRLDGELAAYLATHTYLRYGEPHFWPRLLRALPATAHRLRAKLPQPTEKNSAPVKQID